MNLLQMSVSAGILIIAIIVVRALAINRLPKQTFLALWWLALIRLLLPFSFPSPFSVYSLADRTGMSKQMTNTPIVNILPFTTPQIAGDVSGNVPNTIPVSLWSLVWIVGVVLCVSYFAVSYFKYRREFIGSLLVENSFVAEWLKSHKLKRQIEVRQSSRIKAPLTYGILHPVILMPKRTDWTDTKKLQYVLQHEYVHIRRFDAVTKILLTGALCVHWFNPLVWAMFILANRDLELSCDEAVVRSFGETIKSAYAMALISLEEQKSSCAPFCSNFSKNAIEERITSIMKIKKVSLFGVVLAFVLVSILTIGVMAAPAANAQTDTTPPTVKANNSFPQLPFSTTDKDNIATGQKVEEKQTPQQELTEYTKTYVYNDEAVILPMGDTPISVKHSDKDKFTEQEWNDILAKIENGEIMWED